MSNAIQLSTEKLNIIVAYTSDHRYIGFQNDLPWKRNLRGDKSFLKHITCPYNGQKLLLVMGRVTYEHIPAFKTATLAVITQRETVKGDAMTFNSLDLAIKFGRENGYVIIIFGGENVFREALNHSHRIFCTVVNAPNLAGDRVFPPCSTQISNVSIEVEEFLLSKGAKKTWELNSRHFVEDGFTYEFFMGETA